MVQLQQGAAQQNSEGRAPPGQSRAAVRKWSEVQEGQLPETNESRCFVFALVNYFVRVFLW